jgi:sugar lactone lactonase YvrE
MRFRIALALLACAASVPAAAQSLWVAEPFTAEASFTEGVEGPAADARGNVYAVSFARQNTIGRVTPEGKAEIFVTMPPGSLANGIRFDRRGRMYVADYRGHNILEIDPASRDIRVFAHSDQMHQPNDLAIAPDGTLYASDPDWKNSRGQVWRIGQDGVVLRVASDMGTTNGIEVSPDGKTLYVNESVQRNVWAFHIGNDGTLSGKRLLINFPDYGMDGMRCDVDGNLYITRHGKGTVARVSPDGKVTREIPLPGKMPTNLCFGGPDGRTCYVTEVQHRRLLKFRADRPGLEWWRWQEARP